MPRTSCALLGPHGQVLAAERHDPRVGLAVDPARDAVGLQPGADDEPVDAVRLAAGHDDERRRRPAGSPVTAADVPYVAPGGPQLARHRLGDGGVVGDRGGRRVQGGQPGRMRLELADLAGVDPTQARHAVLPGRPLQRVQAADLVRRRPRRPACRRRRRAARARRSSPPGAAGRGCTARPSGCPAGSRCRRAPPRSCGRSGGRRRAAPSPRPRRCCPGVAGRARAPRPGPRCRRRRPRRSPPPHGL